MLEMSQTDEEETSELESYVFDQDSLGTNHSTLASKLALLAATGHATSGESNSDDQISVDAETQARLEALLEAAGIGKLSTSDGKAFADPEVLRRLSSSVSCALDEAAAALSKMKADSDSAIEPAQGRTLVEACSDGDVNTVRKFLFEGRSANETTEDGESLLSLACSAGYYELAEILLSVPPYADASTYLTNKSSERLRSKLNCCYLALLNQQLTKVLLAMHANVEDSKGKGECTPLMEAASGGYLDIVKLLVSHGAQVNAASTTGNTALTYACCGGYEDVVAYLVSEGASLENPNANGHTPLMEAASGGHIEVAAILLKHGAGINTHSIEFKESALTLACYKGHLHMVRFLLQAGADREHKTEEMHTALMEASMDGHVEVAKLLLDHGAKVNMPIDSFESPLTLAACGGHVELADLLIQKGALLEEINDEGYTPLMEAAREGHEEMVALLLTKGAVVNTKTEETQETALTLACCGGFLGCAKLLLSAGADIEAGCSTPIMEAAQEGQLHLVKYLYEQGANINATTSSGDTALSYAAEHGHTDVADYLLAAGGELEHETEGGRTPLMKAARAGHLCTVQFLISRGADVNRKTKNNEHSVLSLACVCGHLSVVELLLCHGADPNHKLKDGSNMLLEAAKGGHTTIVQLLLDFPHNFMSLSPENTQVTSPSPEQSTPRVPTQSLPMVVPPQEPDRAPEHPLVGGSNPSELACLTDARDMQLPEDNEKTASQLQAFYQQQLQYYQQQQNLSGPRSEAPFNTTALVTHLMQQGGLLSQESSQLSPEGKLAVDKDVASTVESFLKSMVGENADKSRTAESIVEEAQGKLTELELRIKEAIEKNAQLKNVEMMQDDHLRKEKVEELYKTREEQIQKKQKILEELQKVERELQMKTQQQLKKHHAGTEEETPSPRGNPDGREVAAHSSPSANAANDTVEQETTQQQSQSTNKVSSAVARRDNPVPTLPTNQQLHNGSSGSFPQPIKDMDESFCQCVYHPCSQLSHPQAEASGFAQSGVVPFPNLEIDGHTESNHDTPLTLAAAGGHDDLVQFLICRGANIEHKDKKGFTPLILAATAGHIRVVQRLLEANVDIEAQSDRTKDTPLSLACSGGRKDVVELLLMRGANKEHRNVSDYTPLSLAASGGYVGIIKILLSSGAEINSRTGSKLGISPLMLAAMNGHENAVRLLLDMGADINAQIETNRNTSLTLACFQGRQEVVKLLVKRKANVEHRAKTGLTPLMEAASGGYADVGKVLLDNDADPNAAPVPSSRDTALTIAADKGHIRFCQLVLERGAQVDVRNKKGNTPLWLACNGGHYEVVKLLVNAEADINAVDNRNVTPLMAAFRKGHVQVVRWLATQVSQFPSDAECMRYIATISDRDLLKRTQQCMECIGQAKELQAQEANKFASELLEEIDMEKSLKEDLKEKAARKRQKRKMKRKQKTTKKEDGKEDAENDTTQNHKEAPQESSESLDHVISSTRDLRITSSTTITHVTSQKAPVTVPQSAPSTSTMLVEKPATNEKKMSSPATESAIDSTVLPSSPVRVKLDTSEMNRKEQEPPLSRENVTSNPGETSPRQPAIRKVRKPTETTMKSWPNNRETNSYDNAESSGESMSSVVRSSSRCPPLSNNNNSQPITARSSVTTPSKRSLRREEGWKEVATKSGKRIMVSSNLISRVIGRAGCNINAIREVTGAHIDIDKQRKGALERTVTIKGAADAIRYAQQLITALLKEDNTDNEVIDVIFKAQAAQNQLPVAKPIQHKATMAVVAAPIPSKPAWVVPPSIVAQSSRQNHQNAITSSVGTDGWTAPVTMSATLNNNASNVPGKWPLPSCSSSTPSTDASSTIQTARKALFATPQQPPVTAASSPSVSFASKPPDKVVSKPVQPVAPMVSTKITSTSASRVSKSSYGPVGSGIPSQHQVYPVMSQPQLPSDRLCVSRPQGGIPSVVVDRVNQNHPVVSGSSNSSNVAQNSPSVHSVAPQSLVNSDQAVGNPMRTATASSASGHNPLMQNQSFRTSVQSSSISHNPVTPPHTGQPIQRVSGGVARTPLRSSNVAGESSGASGEVNRSYPHIRSDANAVASPTYSPFRSSFTPNTALWSNEAAPVSPYDDQRGTNPTTLIEPDAPKAVVDQAKAPGYRGSAKSPASDNTAIGNSAIQGRSTGANISEISTSPRPQQGSPDTESEVNGPSKPRPIGTERAALHRRANPPPPITTLVGSQPADIWSYDKLTPEQIGMRPLEQQNYANWSTVAPLGRNNCVITTATSQKPQVTASEISSSSKAPTVENQPPTTQAPIMSYPPYPPGPPPAGLNEQGHVHSNSSRFSQISNPRKMASHAPIGSHLGGSSSVGVVGPQQQQTSLKPIGSHLGGAGHIRNNPTYPQMQQVQRNFPGNPMQQQQQQAHTPRYHHVPYYMQQPEMSRYAQSMGSDVNWQQQPQQQQHPMYNPSSRHPSVGQYQHKEILNSNGMYGPFPPPYSNNMQNANANQGPVIQGYSNPVLTDSNQSFQVHPDTQASYVREDEHYYNGGNEYVMRGVVPNNFTNPSQGGNADWDHRMGRTGYQLANAGVNGPSMVGPGPGFDAESQQQQQQMWKDW